MKKIKQSKPKRRTLTAGPLRIPPDDNVRCHRAAGFSAVQAYVRAFNDYNHLKHTAFEMEKQEEA